MKNLFLLIGLALAGGALAQNEATPIFELGVYPVKISPDGKWVGTTTLGTGGILNTETEELNLYDETFVGLGNVFSSDGTAVGSNLDKGIIFKNGKVTTPPSLRKYWLADINGITPDGSRICGVINNTAFDNWDLVTPINELMYFPFYCDIDENFEVSEPVILPHPEKDLFGQMPQYATAVWISEDGKTILGQVQDDMGFYCYPIVYTQNDDNEWSYTLPTESLFNLNKISMPDYPWANEPSFPEAIDFMYPETAEIFQELQDQAAMGYIEYPDPYDYMTEEQWDEYVEAVYEYNEWFDSVEQKIKDYSKAYSDVVSSSVNFPNNDFSLIYDGKIFVASGIILTPPAGSSISTGIYRFVTETGEYECFSTPADDLNPHQILSDGTIFASTPFSLEEVVHTYVLLPETKEFITLEEYFEAMQPAYASWMKETIPNGSGFVNANQDMTVFAGGVIYDAFPDHGVDLGDEYNFVMYVFTGASSGVNNPEITSTDEYYRVYNLMGQSVLQTPNKEDLDRLPKGMYIINGKKVMLSK